ncbi:MAG: ExeM/NucH family extracellular endonuclease [Cyanobacteria bacterium J06621_3]
MSTQNNTLRRNVSVMAGDDNPDDAFDPSLEFTGFPTDTFDGLGSFDDDGGNSGGGSDPTAAAIYEVQGSGRASDLVGETVVIEGVVTGDFQDGDADEGRNLRGFYVQDEMGDGDAATSDGVFVFEGGDFLTDVNVGDKVSVTGTVNEFFGETQISASEISVIGSGSVAPVVVDLPTVGVVTNSDDELIADLEQYEGMLVSFEEALTVDEYFNYDRFGEIVLSEGDRPFQFTQTNDPSVEGYQAFLEDLARRRITLDDGQSLQNPDPLAFPAPGFSDANNFRGGDTVTGLTGNVRFSRASGGSGDETYRIEYTEDPVFTSTNPRPATPEDVGGRLKVSSFNVLNYFATLDVSGNSTANESDPRGADSVEEFERQTEKLVEAILTLDADVLGLVELENDFLAGSSGNAIETLVNRLNQIAGEGTYDWVDPGQQFVDVSDAISVGAIYKPGKVSIAAGTNPAILTDDNLPEEFAGEVIFNGPSTNRAPLAVTFEEIETGGKFTIAVNHFKSKGSVFDEPGNTDIGDGQANNNAIRVQAAEALSAWLASDPTDSGDADYLVLGDLNAYAKEGPIKALEAAGYADLAQQFLDDIPYSFLFDGQLGTLDYALANTTLLAQVTGVTEWHVNADEPDALDYNLDFNRNPSLFNGDNPYRNSDHDPILVGLDLAVEPDEPNRIDGTRDDDRLVGTREDDFITGNNGDDIIRGLDGNDIIEGGRGGDIIKGNRGDDILAADRVDRFQDFDGQRSKIEGGRGNDTIYGGSKDDLLRGGSGDDVIFGKDGDDDIRGGTGDDLIYGGIGNDRMAGSGGVDTADYSDIVINGVFGTVAGLDANLSTRRAVHSSTNKALAWNDRLFNIENVTGTQRNDRFVGNRQDNVFDGQGEVGRSDRQTTFTDAKGKTYQVTADVVEYQGMQADYTFGGVADNFTVAGNRIGTDTLINIEFLRFNGDDTVVATADLF